MVDRSLIDEKSLITFYFPSINKDNYEEYKKEYLNILTGNQINIFCESYDLMGLRLFSDL